jgi:hypothetical protein
MRSNSVRMLNFSNCDNIYDDLQITTNTCMTHFRKVIQYSACVRLMGPKI